MKNLVLASIVFFSIFNLKAHNGELLVIKNVDISAHCDHVFFDFEIENVNEILLKDVRIVLSVGDLILSLKDYEEFPLEKITKEQMAINVDQLKMVDLKNIEIKVTEIFGLQKDWGGWHGIDPSTENYNDIGDFEIFADAPWRMNIFNDNEERLPIPILIMGRYGKDVLTNQFKLNIEYIDLYVKKATDADFGEAINFSHLDDSEFQSLISSRSPDRSDIGIQSFDQSLVDNDENHSFAFKEIENTNQGYEYTKITNEYWFFSLMLPPQELIGFTDNDYLDIKVKFTLRNASGNTSFRTSYLRVFRSATDLPTIPGYFRGDTHVHTMYTHSILEFGNPLKATKEAAAAIGIDWIIATDHTSDFDNWTDGNMEQSWDRLGVEINALNEEDTAVVFIRGQEVSLLNRQSELVHFLAYPGYETPTNLPYLGDGGGDIQFTDVTTTSTYIKLEEVGGFAYAAHPFATADELAVVGGLWNVGDVNFPSNGSTFDVGGSVQCNKINQPSDLFSNEPGKLVQDFLKGAQIWGDRYSMIAAADPYDPYNIKQDPNGSQFAEAPLGDLHYLNRYRQGEQVVNFVNLKGLKMKNINPQLENFKFFFSAGTDAHGSFNYSNTAIFGTFLDANNEFVKNFGFGNISCVAYCQNGVGSQGQNALKAMYDGNFSVSDGPLLINGISLNGNNESEVMMGMDTATAYENLNDIYVNFQYVSTDEFGETVYLKVFVGTEDGEKSFELSDLSELEGTISMKLVDLLESAGDTLALDKYIYVRSELQTLANYALKRPKILEEERFHCFTNPVWIKLETVIGISNHNNEKFNLYPNPADKLVHIETAINLDQVFIYNAEGKLAASTKVKNKSIDVSNLPSGNYTLEFEIDGAKVVKKLVVF